MKKKIVLIICVVFIFGNTFSQKATKGFFGMGLDYKLQREVHVVNDYPIFPGGSGLDYRIESYNYFPALKFDYYFAKTYSINLFFRPSFVDFTKIDEQTNLNKYYSKSNVKRFSMDLGIGIEKHFLREFKIDPFVGISAHYLLSDGSFVDREQLSFHNQFGTLSSKVNTKGNGVATHGFYSTVNFGMNYFIAKNFSVGANLDLGYRYSVQIGKTNYTSVRERYDIDGKVIEENTTENNREIKNINSGFIYSFSVKAAFYIQTLRSKAK